VADEVRDNEEKRRFELVVDGHMAFAAYQASPGVVTFTHTESPKELAGKGVGSKLARGALDQVRARGLKAVARCPFIAGFIQKNPDYQDLLK
jgi:predicted GNAT family acetyltransferase